MTYHRVFKKKVVKLVYSVKSYCALKIRKHSIHSEIVL